MHRTSGHFTVTDNRSVGSEDFDTFKLTAPSDSRLPGGGNYTVTAYDVKSAKFGQVDNFVTFARNYGNQTEHYNGVDFTVDARLRRGLTASGGFTTGRKATDNCEIAPKLPEMLTVAGTRQPLEFCSLQTPFLTQLKGLATYTLPRFGVQLAGTFQSKPTVGQNFPGIATESLAANWVVANSAVFLLLGRNLSGVTVATVNIVKPGTLYGQRLNQVDFRVAKIVRFEQRRMNLSLDFYNIFNSNAIESYQQTFGPSWLSPLGIIPARFAKLGAQFDF